MINAIQKVQSDDRLVNQLQSNIATATQPAITNQLINGILLTAIALTTGSNTVNHKLGRNLVGWFIVRQRAQAQIFDTQDSNQNPSINLLLTSSANVSVDLYVF